jgi:tetraacyldisaccharide 4'-kinase
MYNIGRQVRQIWARSRAFPLPNIVLGGITTGGSGKTPTALAIAKLLQTQGSNVHFLSRGYGRTKNARSSIIQVTTAHTAHEVGDEPLLLAEVAPTWVATDRFKAAQEASQVGAQVLILDDGFYNPYLQAMLAVLVYDAFQGVGNGRLLPAGPLRAPIVAALKKADLIVSIGGDFPFASVSPSMPVLTADLVPVLPKDYLDQHWIAFAGIGHPDKFFEMLRAYNFPLTEVHAFPDHHSYTSAEMKLLHHKAETFAARLITTRKDFVRLPNASRASVVCLDVSFVWRHPESDVRCLLNTLMTRRDSATPV